MKELHYGSMDLVARMVDSDGRTYDILDGAYTIDVWRHGDGGFGGRSLYRIYMDMTIAEVIAELAKDFGFVELVDGEVCE